METVFECEVYAKVSRWIFSSVHSLYSFFIGSLHENKLKLWLHFRLNDIDLLPMFGFSN